MEWDSSPAVFESMIFYEALNRVRYCSCFRQDGQLAMLESINDARELCNPFRGLLSQAALSENRVPFGPD